jgi:uncharacterized membrane protein YphA (DoxX/SURF4 family)
MRIVNDYILPVGLGLSVAWGISKLVGLFWPIAALPVFLIMSAGWLYFAWCIISLHDPTDS